MKYISTLLALFLFSSSYAVIGPVTGSTTFCAGSVSTLSDTTAGGTWISNNVAIATIGSATGIATGIAAGTVTITYHAGAGYVTTLVTINPAPTGYSVTGGGTYCAGGTGLSVGLSYSDGGVNYFLHIGTSITGPVTGSGGALSFGPQTAAGIYTISAVNTSTSCSAIMTGSVVITVAPIVTPSVNISANPGDTVCLGTTTVFSTVPTYGGSAPLYQWKVNGTLVGAGPSYTYVPANGDRITIRLNSNAPCVVPDTATDTLVMSVSFRQTPAVVAIVSPGDTICADYFATFNALSFYGGSAPLYKWLVNGISVGTGGSYGYIPTNLDVVKCVMVSNYHCVTRDTVADSVQMVVVNPVIPSFTINAYPGYVIESGTNDTLVALVSGSAPDLTYQWIIGDSVQPGATHDTFIYNNPDLSHRTDSISCVIYSHGYCLLSTINWAYVTGIDEGVKSLNTGLSVTMFPNPNDGTLTIKGALASHDAVIEVMDILGQIVYREKLAVNGKLNKQISLPESTPDGMYILKLCSDGGSKSMKFMISR